MEKSGIATSASDTSGVNQLSQIAIYDKEFFMASSSRYLGLLLSLFDLRQWILIKAPLKVDLVCCCCCWVISEARLSAHAGPDLLLLPLVSVEGLLT